MFDMQYNMRLTHIRINMLNFIHDLSALISKHLVAIAEVILWAFVAVGVFRVVSNGINGISSFLLGSSLFMIGLSALFYLIAFGCKLIDKKPNKERKYAIIRTRKD